MHTYSYTPGLQQIWVWYQELIQCCSVWCQINLGQYVDVGQLQLDHGRQSLMHPQERGQGNGGWQQVHPQERGRRR